MLRQLISILVFYLPLFVETYFQLKSINPKIGRWVVQVKTVTGINHKMVVKLHVPLTEM